MLIVADTSPLNYLILIEQIDVLPKLFSAIAIPPAVQQELLHPAAPEIVREWAAGLPTWAQVVRPQGTLQTTVHLGAGEHEAILLAETTHSLLLIDEEAGRQEAARHGLRTIGTLGVLRRAHLANLLQIRDALTRLQQTTFKASPDLFAKIQQGL